MKATPIASAFVVLAAAAGTAGAAGFDGASPLTGTAVTGFPGAGSDGSFDVDFGRLGQVRLGFTVEASDLADPLSPVPGSGTSPTP